MYRTPILLWLLVSFCPLTVTAADIDPQSIVFLKCIDSDGKERSGSGAIVSAEGHVLTAKHVAPPGSDCKARTSRLAVDKETIADHFAHLILATLFFTEVELQTQSNPFGGCPQ